MGKRSHIISNLWNWAFHSKISRKISTVFFLFLFLSVILTYFSYRYVSREYVLSNMEQHSRQTMTSIRSNIVEMVENTNNSYNLLLKSGISDMTKLPLSPTERKYYDNYLFTVIDSYNHLDSIYVMNLKGQIYGVDKFSIKTLVIHSVTEAPWYQRAMAAKGSCILSLRAGNIFVPDYTEDFLSAIRVINDLETQKPIGFSIMNIPTRSINQTFENVFNPSDIKITLYDDSGEIISTYGTINEGDVHQNIRHFVGPDFPYYSSNGREYLSAGIYIPEYDWKLTATFPLKYETALSTSLLRISFRIFFINIVLMLICVIILAKSIQRPVSQMIQAMGHAESGDFKPVTVRHPASELGLLEIHYNHLIGQIQFLMDRLVQEQKLKRKTELRALQEQMKPHFLYNTLDTIGYIMLTGDLNQAYDAITTLGSFYRQSLSKGRPFITIEQEIQIVKDYTALLSLRYEELFTTTYEVDEALYQHEIIKLLLQPLVENSIYHGIKPLGEPGIIHISVRRQSDLICITVSDNGIGMEENLIKGLLSSTSPSSKESFGLAGTIERVYISYPEKGSVEICSKKGMGTSVMIKIPF
jgi:two-component system sensor histidine kinase YesM